MDDDFEEGYGVQLLTKPPECTVRAYLSDDFYVHKSSLTQEEWLKHRKQVQLITDNSYLEKKARDNGWTYKPRVENHARLNGEWYVFPRAYGIQAFGYPKDDRRNAAEGRQIQYPCLFDGNPVDRLDEQQKEIFHAAMNALQSHGGAVIVQNTGGGKTFILLVIAIVLGIPIMVVLTAKVHMKAWEEELNKQFVIQNPKTKKPAHGLRIGQIGGGKRKTGDIILAMSQTLSQNKWDPEMFRDVGLVVLDELHEHAALTRLLALKNIGCIRYLMGLTATLKEDQDKLFSWYIGPIAYKSHPATIWSKETIVQRVIFTGGRREIIYRDNEGKDPDNTRTIEAMESDEERIEMLLQQTDRLMLEGRRVMFFVEHIACRESMTQRCKARYPNKKVANFGPDSDQDTIIHQIHDLIITTYRYSQASINILYVDTILLAVPAPKDHRQCIGRIRPSRATNIVRAVPLIIDVIDTYGGFHKGRWDPRCKTYQEKEMQCPPPMVIGAYRGSLTSFSWNLGPVESSEEQDDLDLQQYMSRSR